MMITNPPKALIALVGLICLTVLMALNAIQEATGTGLIGSILGYAIGNGVAARKGDLVSPIIGRKPDAE
jgi:membrane protein YqaA with SNARE-associated domain